MIAMQRLIGVRRLTTLFGTLHVQLRNALYPERKKEK